MKDLISVIIPVYNAEKVLTKCINSILVQEYRNFEIILVNDGSQDSSGKICAEYSKRYNTISVIHQENSGPSRSRNIGLEAAKGKYVAFIDSDDYVHPMYLGFLKSQMDYSNVQISCCSYTKNSFKLYKGQLDDTIISEIIGDNEAFGLLLDNQEFCAPWAKLYKIEVLRNLRFQESILYEDMFFTPQVFKIAKKIAFSHVNLYYYNQEGTSIIRSPWNESKLNQFKNALNFWVSFSIKHYPDYSNRAEMVYYKNLLNLCKEIGSSKVKEINEIYQSFKITLLGNSANIIASKEIGWKDKTKLMLLKFNIF